MERVNSDQLNLFKTHSRIIFAGCSNSGKSFLINKIIEKYDRCFDKIITCGIDEGELTARENIEVKRGNYDPMTDDSLYGHVLLVVDDLMHNKHYLQVVANVFAKGRHRGISCIFVTQNLYLADKHYRTISLNASHFLLFKMRDIRQIAHFARTFIERENQDSFVSCYRKNVLEKEYGHLLVDFTKQMNNPLMLRSNLLGSEFQLCIQL